MLVNTDEALSNCEEAMSKLWELQKQIKIFLRENDEDFDYIRECDQQCYKDCCRENSILIREKLKSSETDVPEDDTNPPPNMGASPPFIKPPQGNPSPILTCCDQCINPFIWTRTIINSLTSVQTVLTAMKKSDIPECEYKLWDLEELQNMINKNTQRLADKYVKNLN